MALRRIQLAERHGEQNRDGGKPQFRLPPPRRRKVARRKIRDRHARKPKYVQPARPRRGRMFHAPDARKIRPKARPVPRNPRKGHIYRRTVRGLFQPKIRCRPRENPVLRRLGGRLQKACGLRPALRHAPRRAHVERALRSRREQARRRQVFKGFRKKDFRLVRWARNGSDRSPYGRILFVARASAKRASPESL